jgi:hypothetical protein
MEAYPGQREALFGAGKTPAGIPPMNVIDDRLKICFSLE